MIHTPYGIKLDDLLFLGGWNRHDIDGKKKEIYINNTHIKTKKKKQKKKKTDDIQLCIKPDYKNATEAKIPLRYMIIHFFIRHRSPPF